MQLTRDRLTQELDRLLPSGRAWLLARGYIAKSDELSDPEYSWTKEGLAWIAKLGGISSNKPGGDYV